MYHNHLDKIRKLTHKCCECFSENSKSSSKTQDSIFSVNSSLLSSAKNCGEPQGTDSSPLRIKPNFKLNLGKIQPENIIIQITENGQLNISGQQVLGRQKFKITYQRNLPSYIIHYNLAHLIKSEIYFDDTQACYFVEIFYPQQPEKSKFTPIKSKILTKRVVSRRSNVDSQQNNDEAIDEPICLIHNS